MLKYTVAEASGVEELQRQVNDLLKDGWQLQGGVSVSIHQAGACRTSAWAQALVKEIPAAYVIGRRSGS